MFYSSRSMVFRFSLVAKAVVRGFTPTAFVSPCFVVPLKRLPQVAVSGGANGALVLCGIIANGVVVPTCSWIILPFLMKAVKWYLRLCRKYPKLAKFEKKF
jgi:hypothetical protein